jgi:hypothetical protein
MRIKQKDVPVRLRRIVAQHLESIRQSKIGQNTQDLYLGEEVCPIYRPDLEKPAYYEFQVLKATRENLDSRKDLVNGIRKINFSPLGGFRATFITPDIEKDSQVFGIDRLSSDKQGFILVSSGEHDFPIPHWSLESMPPSVFLESKAISQKKKLAKVYKIDSLTYLGEDSNGEEIDHLGDMPALIKGLPSDLAKYEGKITSSYSSQVFSKYRSMDDSTGNRPSKIINRGAKSPELKFLGSDWKTLKKEFNTSFKPMLEMVKKSARSVWEIEDVIEKMGEGIIAGEIFNLVPIEKKFTVEISGEAAEFVKTRIVKRPEGNSVVELHTTKMPFNREVDLIVEFNYGGDFKEKVNLFVVNGDTPSESNTNDKTEDI